MVIFDCLIVGAGQAGLAVGRLCQQGGLNSVILEKGHTAGSEWDKRAPEHKLFTPRSLSRLPGLEMRDGPAHGYPSNAEMAHYFADYARTFELPVQTGCHVVDLSKRDGVFVAVLQDGQIFRAHSVVLANGSNQAPKIPQALAEPIAQSTLQTTARDFWTIQPQPGARILVVGDGASGRQTALDCAGQGFETTLACANRRLAPEMILGRSLFNWLMAARLLLADRDTWRAKLLRRLNPVPSKKALGNGALKRAGVALRPKLTSTIAAISAAGKPCGQGGFADGSSLEFDQVIWCIGYEEDSPFNGFAPEGAQDWYTKGRGTTDVPGLIVTGRVWLKSRASELIIGASHDAVTAVEEVKSYLATRPAQTPPLYSAPSVQAAQNA